MKSNQIGSWARVLVSLTLVVLMVVGKTDKIISATPSLPTVRVGIGMSFEELKAGSTFPFVSDTSVKIGKDFQAFQINTSFNFIYVDGSSELRLDKIGGPRELTSITVDHGKVSDMTVTVQTDKTNLHQAMQQAHALYKWFVEHGYRAGSSDRRFWVQNRNSKHEIAPITNFDEAEAAFLDSNLKLSEMFLFGLGKGEIGVGVSMANGRRMLAKHSKEYDDESNAADEKRYGLNIFIAQDLKPYQPSTILK